MQPLRSSTDSEAAKAAVVLLGQLAFNSPSRCHTVIDAGGIACLMQALGSDSERLQANAALALGNLSLNDAAANGAMAAAGVVPAAVRLLTSSNATLPPKAAGLLANLSANDDCGRSMAEADAVPLLGALLRRHGEETAAAAAHALANLAIDDEGADAVAPCIPALTECLRSSGGSAELQGEASRALYNLALNSPSRAVAIAAADGADAIVQLLARSPDCTSQPNAIEALARQGQAQAGVAADPSATAELALQAARASCGQNDALCEGLNEALCRLAEARRMLQASTSAGAAAAAGPAAASTSAPAAAAPAPRPPKPRAPRVCANPECGATTGSLRRCGSCAAVRYCSEACARAHWLAHKAECRRLQAEQQAVGGGEASGPAPAPSTACTRELASPCRPAMGTGEPGQGRAGAAEWRGSGRWLEPRVASRRHAAPDKGCHLAHAALV